MCASLTRKGWDPLSCDTVSPFVCETSRRGWAAPATTTVTAASSKTNNIACPSGWSDFNELCYKVKMFCVVFSLSFLIGRQYLSIMHAVLRRNNKILSIINAALGRKK